MSSIISDVKDGSESEHITSHTLFSYTEIEEIGRIVKEKREDI